MVSDRGRVRSGTGALHGVESCVRLVIRYPHGQINERLHLVSDQEVIVYPYPPGAASAGRGTSFLPSPHDHRRLRTGHGVYSCAAVLHYEYRPITNIDELQSGRAWPIRQIPSPTRQNLERVVVYNLRFRSPHPMGYPLTQPDPHRDHQSDVPRRERDLEWSCPG